MIRCNSCGNRVVYTYMDKVIFQHLTFVWIRPVLSIALQDVVSLPKHTNPVNRESPNSCNTFNNPTTNVAENFRNLIFLVEFEIPNYQKQTIQQQMFQKKYISDGLCNTWVQIDEAIEQPMLWKFGGIWYFSCCL